MLLACGAPLFSMNVAKQTPLDSAVAAKQMIIAPILESQMVLMENVCYYYDNNYNYSISL